MPGKMAGRKEATAAGFKEKLEETKAAQKQIQTGNYHWTITGTGSRNGGFPSTGYYLGGGSNEGLNLPS